MKNITVVLSTGGEPSDLAINPGTTPRDILNQLNLSRDLVLTLGKGAEPLRNTEDVYSLVTNGSKLYATTPVEWGELVEFPHMEAIFTEYNDNALPL